MTAEVRTLIWQDTDGERGPSLVLLDQTRLPIEEEELHCNTVEMVAEAIESLRVRGAPAIGVAAAYGVVIGAWQARSGDDGGIHRAVELAIERLAGTRPTAMNLFWALGHMRAAMAARGACGADEVYVHLLATAHRLCENERELCRRMGEHGAELLRDGDRVLTHCNAGALATVGIGTALGLIYAAAGQGKQLEIYADETRPLLQGARLTAWELARNGLNVTVICDSAAGAVMARQHIDCVIVGADRIAANGDVANKIGTYSLAVLAREHNIPFYVAAPTSTVDLSLASGDLIPIEERSHEEVADGFGQRTTADGAQVFNPAFDVTPNHLVTAIITEHGIGRPPYAPTLRAWGIAAPKVSHA
ncbi:MAG: S-methyl-5-thioribose-1-phosphate isomerase [Candidatus Latescibacterota bacterium]|nr:S-methyl-5-thioribose-1-phosphate isomerase [Candidatus Latescibacterota bacterium]